MKRDSVFGGGGDSYKNDISPSHVDKYNAYAIANVWAVVASLFWRI